MRRTRSQTDRTPAGLDVARAVRGGALDEGAGGGERRVPGASSERIDVNPELAPLVLLGPVLHELCSHALAAAPEECCGLVAGSARQRFGRVYRIANVMTKKHSNDPIAFPRDALHAYYMSEAEYLRAQQEAEREGDRITAVYHSHVEAEAYLSREDLAYAEHPLFPFPAAAQIVLSVVAGSVDSAAIFEVDPVRGCFCATGARRIEVPKP